MSVVLGLGVRGLLFNKQGGINMDEKKIVTIVYTNYKGRTAVRKIFPKEICFGHTDWHPEEQWLMVAYDIGKDADRTFAMKDIKSWFVE